MAFATFAKWGWQFEGLAILCTGSRWSRSGDSRGQKHSKDIQKRIKKIKKTYPKDLISKFFAWTFARHVQASYRFFVHKATLRKSEVNHGSSALVHHTVTRKVWSQESAQTYITEAKFVSKVLLQLLPSLALPCWDWRVLRKQAPTHHPEPPVSSDISDISIRLKRESRQLTARWILNKVLEIS